MEQTLKTLYPGDIQQLSDKDREALRPFSLYNSSTSRRHPLFAIVAAGSDGAIGINGDMIWHLREDLRNFKSLTMGHPVIMGRRTWESLPKGALPGRRNIVVSRSEGFSAQGAEVVKSLKEAINICEWGDTPFIIGGGEIYRQSLPYVTRLFLTRILAECPEADTRFPDIRHEEWTLVSESDSFLTAEGVEYKFQIFDRKE